MKKLLIIFSLLLVQTTQVYADACSPQICGGTVGYREVLPNTCELFTGSNGYINSYCANTSSYNTTATCSDASTCTTDSVVNTAGCKANL